MLIDGFDTQVRLLENSLSMLRAAGGENQEGNALMAQLRADVTTAQNSLQEVRSLQYAKLAEIQEIERQLSQLPWSNM